MEAPDEKEFEPYIPLPGELPSEYRKKMEALNRKLKLKMKRAEQFIEEAHTQSTQRLMRRNGVIQKSSQIEHLRSSTVMQNTELKEKFVVEVDEAIENKAHNRALRLYHKEQLELTIPKWLRTLDEITSVAKAKGHNDKLMWRHHVLKVMKRCVKEAAEDPLGVETRLDLLGISRRLNMHHANDLIRMLRELKDEYFHRNEIGDTELARHCNAFANATHKRKDHIDPVPFPKEDWSETIDLQRSTLDHTLASTNLLGDDHTIATFDFASTLSSSAVMKGVDVDHGQKEAHHDSKRAAERDDIEKMRSAKLVQLRLASAKGNFSLAWSIFRKYLDPASNAPTAKKGGRPRPVPMSVYKLLLVAVKNGGNIFFDEAQRVLEHLLAHGAKPDVSIYNMIIGSCVPESRWRRALTLVVEMKEKHHLIPNPFTLELLSDCCRHTLEEPGVIYDTLRSVAQLPSEYCYNVSVCNAGNRLSPQVIAEAMHDVTSKMPDKEMSTYQIGKHYSDPAMKTNKLMTTTSKRREFSLGQRNSLPLGSPAKYSFSRTAMAFDRQMEKHICKPGKDYAMSSPYAQANKTLPPLHQSLAFDTDVNDTDDFEQVRKGSNLENTK